ncbi:hypothetical protein EXE42_18270, partial [Halorubrum sp. SP3]
RELRPRPVRQPRERVRNPSPPALRGRRASERPPRTPREGPGCVRLTLPDGRPSPAPFAGLLGRRRCPSRQTS